jgi:hypothetical protein
MKSARPSPRPWQSSSTDNAISAWPGHRRVSLEDAPHDAVLDRLDHHLRLGALGHPVQRRIGGVAQESQAARARPEPAVMRLKMRPAELHLLLEEDQGSGHRGSDMMHHGIKEKEPA